MLEAVVGVALRAILASVLLGGVLAALVLIATRALALTAATRHALWTTALFATALMPLAGVGVSVARAYGSNGAPPLAARPPREAWGPRSELATRPSTRHDSTALAASPASKPQTTSQPNTASDARAGAAVAPSFADRLAFTAWTPRVTRALALGVVGVWVLGALIGLFGLVASIARVRGLKRRSSPLDGTLADELPWLTAAGSGREIYLRLSYETETPVAIGFRRPVILIPTELATADGLAAIESLVLHEHAHLRRYDDWTNLVQRTIERIFWFNPVVWLVGRRIALEREIASDDAVVEKTGEPHEYATSLWKLAREMRMPEHAVVAPGALLTRKQITVRIEQLLDKKRARLHRSPAAALGVALAGVLAVGFVATSAPAVELPVTEAPLAAASTAPASNTIAWKRVVLTNGAAKHAAAPHAGTAHTGDFHALTNTNTRVVTGKTEQQSVRYQIVAAPPVVRDRIVYVDRVPSTKGSAAGANAAGNGNADGNGGGGAGAGAGAGAGSDETPPVPPAPPGAPQVPAPPVRPPHVPAVSQPLLSPKAAAAIRVATAAAARLGAQQAHDATAGIGPEIAREISSAMASMPHDIAQENGVPRVRRARHDNVKITREMVAACIGCSFRNSDGRGVDLHGLRIVGDDFTGANLTGANLSGAALNGVSLAGANLQDADLRGAKLNGVDLERANFDGAQLENVTMAGIAMQRVSLRGAGLRSIMSNCTGCDFSRMDLHGQDLHGITLNGADLARSDLRGANLSGVHFNGVDLSGADLSGADLTNAHLDGCDMSNADLRNARTAGMIMRGSSLGD
jgi:uncharacterized protein YjbI with pentapeptide repeats/beta-lactamase regulating signal transducer with metallopeptidase domain